MIFAACLSKVFSVNRSLGNLYAAEYFKNTLHLKFFPQRILMILSSFYFLKDSKNKVFILSKLEFYQFLR